MDQKKINSIFTAYYDSPIGLLQLQGDESKLVRIKFIENQQGKENSNIILKEGILQLKEYFEGKRLKFNLPLKFNGTDFQMKVWTALNEIDFGEVMSYKDIAKKINHPKAYRAVGNANNKNQIPMIMPCHRVIGSGGKLTGYAGGLWRKEWLLAHEKEVLERMLK